MRHGASNALLALTFLGLTLAVSGVAWAREGADTILQGLADSSYKVRLAAAATAGRHRIRQAAPGLREALRDSSPLVRAAAAIALGQIGDQSSREALVGLLKDRERAVARAAEKGLELLDEEAGRPGFLVKLDHTRLPDGVEPSLAGVVQDALTTKLTGSGKVLLTSGEEAALGGMDLRRHLMRRRITGLRLMPSVKRIEVLREGAEARIVGRVDVIGSPLDRKKIEFSMYSEAELSTPTSTLDDAKATRLMRRVLAACARSVAEQVLENLEERER